MNSLLLSALFAPLMVATAQPPVVNNYGPPKNSTILTTTNVDWDSLTSNPSAVGESRPVFDNPTTTLDKFEVHVTTLKPGMSSHPVHRHVWEEMLLMKEGSVEVSINGQKHHAGPGSLIFLASNDPHNATNTGTTPATYYVINFVPNRIHSMPDKSAAEQAVPGKLASSVIDCNSQPSTPTPTGSKIVCVNSPTLTFVALESHISTLNPGQSTAKDMLDSNDEFVVVKSGQVEVTFDGVSSRMNAGSMMFWSPNGKRTLRNIGKTPTSYQVFRVTTEKSPKLPAAH
jgi:mannose-6-phosphate isomerase-like protein (cupin superfamily)